MKILPVILSGGSGTRLWPVSRADYPKQLQSLVGEGTLLQQTAQRLPVGGEVLPPAIICGEDQRFLVAQQLQEAGITPSVIMLEPTARNTAPALAAAALWAQDPVETILVAMPADHFIADGVSFTRAIHQAAALAAEGRLMTLGIEPTRPHTGYGYIERGEALVCDPSAFVAQQFKEKPDATTAQAYLDSGAFYWNAGIFVFRADAYLEAVARHEPTILPACRAALEKSAKDLDFVRLDRELFAQAPNISVDYAVMERADCVGVLPVSFGWSDIGGWAALWHIGAKDADENVVKGEAVLIDTQRSYVHSEDRLIAAVGLNDVVIVDTPDALFVAARDHADLVKDVVAALKDRGRAEGKEHLRVWRPWGSYQRVSAGERYQVKLITVKPGGKLSLQKHHHRAEHWVVVSGTARVRCGDEVKLLQTNESIYIPLGTMHRLENPGQIPLSLIEVQSGDYLGEDDIVRYEDAYRRIAALNEEDDRQDEMTQRHTRAK